MEIRKYKKPSAARNEYGLTERQEKFSLAYMRLQNASAAYREAYSTDKMKPDVVKIKAQEVLNHPSVAARVNGLRKSISEKAEVSQAQVLAELAAHALCDPADLLLPHPENPDQVVELSSPADFRKLPRKVRSCIVGWSWDRSGNFVIKLANKTAALEMIAKHLGMFVERKEIRMSELETLSDEALNNKIIQAAQEIANTEGLPIEAILPKHQTAANPTAETVH